MKKQLYSGFITFLFALAASNAFADITMQQSMSVEAGGFMSMLASQSTVTTSIAGDKSRSETKMAPKSGFMGSLMKNLDTVSIMRLDKDLAWQLMPEKQKYSEMTFQQLREQIAEGMKQLEEMQQSGGAGALPVSEEECEWSDPEMDVIETGERKRFANVKAKQHIITVQETCTVPDSGQTCVLKWTMENWMAKKIPGGDEALEFREALAEKLGTEDMISGIQAMSRGLLSMFEEGWEEVMDEAGDLKGYPVKTVMQIEMGGESCSAMSGQPIAMDDLWSNAANAAADAATQTAGYHAGQKVAQETAEAMGDSVGGSIAGSAVGAASGEVISGFLKRFRKKKPKTEPQPVPSDMADTSIETQANLADGSVVLFRITSELTDINDHKIPLEQFEVPAGWKKVSAY